MCIWIFWNKIRQMRRPRRLGYMNAEIFYDRVVHTIASISARSWGLPFNVISMLLSTLQVMTFSLRTGFEDLDIIYGVTSDKPYQGLLQGNLGGTRLCLYVSTYLIKTLQQKVRSIPINFLLSAIKKLLASVLFIDDMDIPVEGNSTQEFHKNMQEAELILAVGLRETGVTLQPEKCFWKMVDFDWTGVQWTYKKTIFHPHYWYLTTNVLASTLISRNTQKCWK